MVSAAAVIIGDEILSGKVTDSNTSVLIRLLWARGIHLARVAIVTDDLDAISAEVRRCSEAHDWVITSGGIGPTHDDRTMEGIARAFDVPLIRPPSLEQAVRAHMGARMSAAALKLATVPAGAQLLDAGAFPTVLFRNIYILPGVPHIFAAKLERICAQFTGRPPVVRRLYLQTYETSVADPLGAVEGANPGIKIGSYPIFDCADHNLLVTIEGVQEAHVAAATAELLRLIPADLVVRVEDETFAGTWPT